MEVFKENICITGSEATRVIPVGTFKTLINRGKISNLAGKASYGNPALYPVDSFPQKYRVLLYLAYPELSNEEKKRELVEEQNAILRNILPDPGAHEFFRTYEYKRRNAICSGAFIKRHLEDNRLYICNSNSETALSIITYK